MTADEVRTAAAKIARDKYKRGSAHTYASENGCCYSAQEDAAEEIAKAILAMPLPADPPQLPDGLMEDLARALEDAKVYVVINCDGGSELRIRFEGPYSPERVHRARNADAALTAWRARKGEAT